MKNLKLIAFIRIFGAVLFLSAASLSAQETRQVSNIESPTVFKSVLENGLTILVLPRQNVPDVAIHLVYNVGSKDEGPGERGLAHLLEHMVFKGTQSMLSETDISLATSKLSGYVNANTDYDRTKYVFRFAKRHWQEALPILADCMTNCTFKQDLLNSEFKTVIQELKMYRDHHDGIARQELLASIFTTHPYHYSVIGIKQDIWDVQSEDLMKFYKKHYIPNNAFLVVVGDVAPSDVVSEVQKYFEHIPANLNYKKPKNHQENDIVSKSVKLYRDIKSPILYLSFNIPPMNKKLDVVGQILLDILANGTSSRLYSKLILSEQLIADVGAAQLMLVDEGLAFIGGHPKDEASIEKIKKIVADELVDLAKNGPTDLELQGAINRLRAEYVELSESVYGLADNIGNHYLATGDENYLFTCVNNLDKSTLKNSIKEFAKEYMRPSLMHEAVVLPISQDDLVAWKKLQENHDKEDVEFLKNRVRISQVEAPKYAHQVHFKPLENIAIVTPKEITLQNGLKVFYHHNPNVPKIECYLKLKADYDYESKEKIGDFWLMDRALFRCGTINRDFATISDTLSLHASDIYVSQGYFGITTFSENLELTLEILGDVLTNATFDEVELEKVKSEMCDYIVRCFDSPEFIASLILYNKIYGEKIYMMQEQIDNITALTRQDLLDCYKKFVSPKDAYMVIVGDLSGYDIPEILENALSNWQGDSVEDLPSKEENAVQDELVEYDKNIDQSVVMIGTNSIDAKHEDYYKLSVAGIILSGDMSSRIFNVRQQTGLFYNAGADLVCRAGIKPGYLCISMIVSPENVEQAELLLIDTLKNLADTLTDEEVEKAKNILLNGIEHSYSKNRSTLNTLIRIYNLGRDWNNLENVIEEINKISTQDVCDALNKFLDKKEFVTVRVGRVI